MELHEITMAQWAVQQIRHEREECASDISDFVNIARNIKHVDINIIIIMFASLFVRFLSCASVWFFHDLGRLGAYAD